jgi:hypothetical protein
MKNFKVSLLGLFAVLIGMAVSSFTIKPVPEANSVVWFNYVSGPVDDPASYSYQGEDPGCSNTNRLCAIRVMEDENQQPDADALQQLYDDNNNFTQPVANLIEFKAAP